MPGTPVDQSLPSITDEQGNEPPIAGDTLSATPGTWSGAPSSYSFQWQDCFSGTCTDISGATLATYTLGASDVGNTVDVVVTAGNNQGSASATSSQTNVVQPATPPAIASVSGLGPYQDDNVVIEGSGFGTQQAFNGDSPYIQLADITGGWNAGNGGTLSSGGCAPSSDGDWVTVNVVSWTNNEIEIDGFTGSYGFLGWAFNPGDQVEVEVWNPQTSAGPACSTVTVGG